MAKAISRYYEILADAVGSHRGVRPVEQGEGDSIVAAFSRGVDAVAAALSAQQQLARETWPEGVDLRVRMASTPATHSCGHVQLLQPDRDSHRPVRAARPRRTDVASRATRDLVAGCRRCIVARSRQSRLKDHGRPNTSSSSATSGAGLFPRAASTRRAATCRAVTTFVGRERELPRRGAAAKHGCHPLGRQGATRRCSS